MNENEKENTLIALFEIFPLCQKIILNSINIKKVDFTKTQLFIMLSLIGKQYLSMTELSTYIASSKEQTTRAVAPLVKDGYLERLFDENNRKLVLIRLTPLGMNFLELEKDNLRNNLEKAINKLSEEDKKEFCSSVFKTLEILKKIEK
ncbi:MAG: MarR family transcriptional regulator [Clostridiales bacterium]|nr:MarR family transcriptional regulator [Clostridiales bacterium]